MADKGMTLAIVLLVAGLIVGGGIGYFAAPTKTVTVGTTVIQTVTEAPLKGKIIKLGYIASDTTALEVGKPYHEQIIASDMNKYSATLGYGTTFQYLVDDAQGQANTHLEKVQGFKSAGVTVFEGGGWSSQAQSALSYCNSNGMLMWSSSSTSPTLALANDNLFRMCTADTALAPALANVMWAAGVKSLVIFQRGDSWGDGIVNLLTPIWTAKGGKIEGDVIRYAAESVEFSNYLTVADEQVKTAVASYNGETQRVGVVILSFSEISVICKQVSSYPNIYNVHWWGSDGTALSQRAMDDAPEEANHIGIYSLLSRQTPTVLFTDLESRYIALTKQQYSAYSAYSYDIATVIANSMYQAQSTDGQTLVPLQAPVAFQLFGAAGWSKLDQYGDRASPPYDVWGFYPGATKASVSKIMATYDPDFQTTAFVPSVLGYTPIGP
ncbi:MAG: ABC transporter substrate-binding protein [Candidatus Bathyarchaeota archaeon]|nr:ABC transporter substrate-binding protein [Candidatus Bathyarchaeota archaeon]